MSLKGVSWSNVSIAGVMTGALWGMINLGTEFIFRQNVLEGTFLSLFLSFVTGGALFGVLILFSAVWIGYPLDRHPYFSGVKSSFILWLISVVLGGIFSWFNPERYHFNVSEILFGGARVILLGLMLGWSVKRLMAGTLLRDKPTV